MASIKARTHCKYGCGNKCAPGTTKRGNPYDTCCASCVKSKGAEHDKHCISRNGHRNHTTVNIPKWKLRRSKPCHGTKTMTLYHVTNKAGADGIKSGNQMIRGSDGMFGGG